MCACVQNNVKDRGNKKMEVFLPLHCHRVETKIISTDFSSKTRLLKNSGQTQINIPCEMFGNSSVFVIHLQWNTNVCTQLHPIHQIRVELRLQRFFGESVPIRLSGKSTEHAACICFSVAHSLSKEGPGDTDNCGLCSSSAPALVKLKDLFGGCTP